MSEHPVSIYATPHLGTLRVAAWTAVVAFTLGLLEWVADAWIMEYALEGSTMWLLCGGAALFAGCNAFFSSSIRVVIEEGGIRTSHGPEILTGRSTFVPWESIHTARITSPPRHRSWFHRLLYQGRGDTLYLLYRSRKRRMLAVPLPIPLNGLDDLSDLLRDVEARADLTWKIDGGDFDVGRRIDFEGAERIAVQIESNARTALLPEPSMEEPKPETGRSGGDRRSAGEADRNSHKSVRTDDHPSEPQSRPR